jgi:hypothetical protein
MSTASTVMDATSPVVEDSFTETCVLYDYTATTDEELSVLEGDTVRLLGQGTSSIHVIKTMAQDGLLQRKKASVA